MENIHPIFERLVERKDRESAQSHKAKVLWFTGLSGSGKSTIAEGVEKFLFHEKGINAKVIDGDNVRAGLCKNLGFSTEDRRENIRRIAELSKLFLDTGILCLNSFVSPTIEIRDMAREIIGSEDFMEVFVNTPLEICEQRDVKGLYRKARKGEIKGFTGIDAPFEAPSDPALELKTENQSVEESVKTVIDYILPRIKL